MTNLGLELVTERGKGTLNVLSYCKVTNLYSHVEWHNSNPYIVRSFSMHICQFEPFVILFLPRLQSFPRDKRWHYNEQNKYTCIYCLL